MRCTSARAAAALAFTTLAVTGCNGHPAVARVYVYSINLHTHPVQLGTRAEQDCLHTNGVPAGEAILGAGSGPRTRIQFVLAVRSKRAWGDSVAACIDALPGHDVRFSNVVLDNEGLFPPER